jgi:hypothetical protein
MEGFIVDLGHFDGGEAQVSCYNEAEDECAYVGGLEVESISMVVVLPSGILLTRISPDSNNKHEAH